MPNWLKHTICSELNTKNVELQLKLRVFATYRVKMKTFVICATFCPLVFAIEFLFFLGVSFHFTWQSYSLFSSVFCIFLLLFRLLLFAGRHLFICLLTEEPYHHRIHFTTLRTMQVSLFRTWRCNETSIRDVLTIWTFI